MEGRQEGLKFIVYIDEAANNRQSNLKVLTKLEVVLNCASGKTVSTPSRLMAFWYVLPGSLFAEEMGGGVMGRDFPVLDPVQRDLGGNPKF